MDSLKILGPYAKKIFSAKKAPAGDNLPIVPNTKAKPKEPTDFQAFYKKKNINFVGRTAVDLKAVRAKEAEDRRKLKRNQIVMENRAANMKVSPAPSTTSTSSRSDPRSVPKKESRVEQLLKWKQEKETLKTSAANKKVPFKAPTGTASTYLANAKPAPLPPVKGTSVAKSVKPREVLKSTENVEHGGVGVQKRVTRAVTRAMAKAQIQPSADQVGLTVKGMKNLKIVEKSNGGVSKSKSKEPGSRKASPRLATEIVQPLRYVNKNKSPQMNNPTAPKPSHPDLEKLRTPVNAKRRISQIILSSQLKTPKPEPQKRIKKTKDMQFDDTYVDFQERFVETCKKLKTFNKKWFEYLSSNKDLSEDTIGQINSTIGQANLLLNSKLPQFAQLVYHYLTRYEDPGPVLGCDLEGWWDVAYISIEKVYELFQKLDRLEANSWKEPKPIRVPCMQSHASQSNATATISVTTPKKSQGRANPGFLAFLAEKRRQMNAIAQEGVAQENLKSEN